MDRMIVATVGVIFCGMPLGRPPLFTTGGRAAGPDAHLELGLLGG